MDKAEDGSISTVDLRSDGAWVKAISTVDLRSNGAWVQGSQNRGITGSHGSKKPAGIPVGSMRFQKFSHGLGVGTGPVRVLGRTGSTGNRSNRTGSCTASRPRAPYYGRSVTPPSPQVEHATYKRRHCLPVGEHRAAGRHCRPRAELDPPQVPRAVQPPFPLP
jgi:hypothetical protein